MRHFLRINIGVDSGLERPSQIQIDKLHTPLRKRIARIIGHIDAATMTEVNRALVLFLGLA
jgi:mRNA interferase MazF